MVRGLDGFQTADKNQILETIKYFYENATKNEIAYLASYARKLRDEQYGPRVYFRGLIEFSNYCKNNCFYCGLRSSNKRAIRYRMTEKEILDSCAKGYDLGFRTFVLQSGEDNYFTVNKLCSLVYSIKSSFPDCAVTLSVGELSYKGYKDLYNSGADRYLLRHETANEAHYKILHPPELSFSNRKKCLFNLKEIGYQVGAGFMVDSPKQTYSTITDDFLLFRELQPHMIGIGPFIPHKDTIFADYSSPTICKTIILLSLTRIMIPKSLIPATTALNTINYQARENGLLAGANVVMPNLTPKEYRYNYKIYDHKLFDGLEASENLFELIESVKRINMIPDLTRGDHVDWPKF